jgi:DNA-binding HxlR family transcriptional regulator
VAGRRTYADRCGVARALDAVGERWALLVVRELLLGPKRFTDLRIGLPGLSADVLAQRLRELEAAGLVRRGTLPPPAASKVYELTPRGQELEAVILALGRWGSVAPFPSGDAAFGPDAVVLALKTLFDPAAADGLEATYELRLDAQPFALRVAGGRFTAARGSAAAAEATIAAPPGVLAAVLWHGRPLADAVERGEVVLSGDRAAAGRLLTLFPLPAQAGGPMVAASGPSAST